MAIFSVNKHILWKKNIIRPTVKLQQDANKIFDKNIDWNTKKLHLKDTMKESLIKYWSKLDMQSKQDTAQFYKIVNSQLRYKSRGKIVKEIRHEEEIIMGIQKDKIVKQFFEKLYKSNEQPYKVPSNGIFDFRLNIWKGIEYWATNKAVGTDGIPEKFFKDWDKTTLIKRLKIHFSKYLQESEIPEYYMEARLILISKDDTEYPEISKTRPISVLPTITKIFELSIFHYLEDAVKSILFCQNQRGFIKGWSTVNNISDLFQIAQTYRESKKLNKKETPSIIFFDFQKTYDSVQRSILMKKLKTFKVPWNIIKIINDMLNKFTLVYMNEKIRTKRGLVQGSVLSPLLFNIYINDLLIAFKINNIEARTFADDIVWFCESREQIDQSIWIMKEWSNNNGMSINSQKSGILKILRRKNKIKGINNELNIPKVESYCYLSIKINQTITLDEHSKILKAKEQTLKKRIGLLKPSIVNTKSRFIIFNTIIRSKFSYVAAVLGHFNPNYIKKWEAIIYRLLKQLLWVRMNVSKRLLFETLEIEDTSKFIRRVMNKINGRTEESIYIYWKPNH